MAAVVILNSKISIVGHVTEIGFNIWCSIPSFIKIRRFFTEIWRYNDFQNGGRPPSWILKMCSFFVMWPLSACRSASANKISLKSDNWSMSYGQKSNFQDGGCHHFEFQKFQFLVKWLSSSSTSNAVYQNSSKSDNFSLGYGDLTMFKMAAVRHLGF